MNKKRERRERYKDIDLGYFRKHMSFKLFQAFVRHIGSIRGNSELDIGSFTKG